jgi:branched-subunit amino acid transport protein
MTPAAAFDWGYALYIAGAVAGLVFATLATRGSFILPERSIALPERVKDALRFAPIAALVGVVAPELLLPNALGPVWPKLVGAAAAAAYYYARRGMLGTIVAGMAAYAVARHLLAPLLGLPG